ncbi:uncharacterized protein LOC115312227 [Ixodes scapularis]|uniref:uncharacterized protein LOC115312227 n=1 Tax=Ixodes scapularis TaxID=6945 RepID=UPI001A9EC70A|nr:uncharacterized protein LOC115312227 [Ixodes scapularis]
MALKEAGILTPVDSSEFASPIVPVVKKNGDIRICGDYKSTINPCLEVDNYPLPRIEEMFATLAGGKFFSKLDLSKAYLQLEMHPAARKYLTINTQLGLFQVNRLPFGIASAPSIFQRTMDQVLQGLPQTTCYLDDILVTGRTKKNPRPNDRDPYNDSSEAPEVGLSASCTPLHHRPPVFRGKCQCRLLVKTPKSNGQPPLRRRRRNVRLLLNTRHPTTRESPAQLMLQRHLRTRLDLLKPSVADCVASAHYRQQRQHPGQERAFTAGDQVYARDYRSGHKWQPGTVAAQTGPVSFQVQVSPGRVCRRHQDQLLRAPLQDSVPSESRPDEAGGVSATAWTDSTPEDSAGDRCLPQASLPAPSEVPRPRSNTQDAETLMDVDNSDGERRYPVRDRRKPQRLIEEEKKKKGKRRTFLNYLLLMAGCYQLGMFV